MKRIMHFTVTIADYFENFKAYVSDISYPIPRGEQIWFADLPIEFDTDNDSTAFEDSLVALKNYVKENYPGKDYRIYYWTLEREK